MARDHKVNMNLLKQHRKLQALNVKAERCLSREEAQKVIRKADKALFKIAFASRYGSVHKK